MRSDLPTGTVTFFFSDMEGSTRLVQELGDRWPPLMDQHDRVVRLAIEVNGGVEVRTVGDSFFAAFASAPGAVAAAVATQRELAAGQWPDGVDVRVRIGLHTGDGVLGGSDYVGLDVHRAARIASAAHGGQVVLSEATALLVDRALPEGVTMRDLGKHRLKDLLEQEALHQVVIPGVSEDHPPLRTLDAVPNNLPVQVTTFVGREDDLAAALEHLRSRRIVTLLGPGGTGKTRLSLQVAAESADDFPDGVYFVPLASVEDPDLVPSSILTSLGVSVASRAVLPEEQLMLFLADKSVLLVLDNFEQLVDAAGIVSAMAARSPASRFLVTSRVPLRVSGEQELPIPPLDMADPEAPYEALANAESIGLFVDRARAVRPDFELTQENARAVAELVNRLDGLPLAIELVVPKLKLLTVDSILERLDTRTLAGGVRDAPERHQTMWNAISWSEEALPEDCRRLFAQLSVFVGGGRLEEIERVCASGAGGGEAVLDLLATLIDHSLVRPERGDRFRMLQVIREFAAARLEEIGGADEVRARHAAAYCDRIEAAFPELTRKDRKAWLEALDADHDNLRAAIAHCVASGNTDGALRFAWSMWRYWQMRGHLAEARRRVEEVLAMEGGAAALRAKAIEARGSIAWWQGDVEPCEESYREALRRQEELGDDREVANALYNLGLVIAFFRGDVEEGRRLVERAGEIYQRLGDRAGLADVHWGLGNVWIFGSDDPNRGIPELEPALEGYRAVGNVFGEGWAQFELGEAHRRLGKHAAARPHYRAGLELLYGTGDVSATVLFLMGIAGVAFAEGDLERAARLAGAAWASGAKTGVDLISVARNRVEGLDREELEALTGPAAAAYRDGRKMSYEAAVRYALEDC